VARLSLAITELQEVVGALRRTSNLTGSLRAQKKKIQNKTVKLEDERRELQTTDHTITVDMVHVFVCQLDVVLCRDVIRQVVVHNQPEKRVQECKLHLLVDLGELCLDHDIAFAILRLPHSVKIVDSLGPLVNQQWRNLGVRRFDPGREKMSLVRLIPQVLVKISIADLLDRLNIINRVDSAVVVVHVDVHLLESSLGQQETLDTL
jgi:hypothetical protein